MTTPVSQCLFCKHLGLPGKNGPSCAAFPDGIPSPVAFSQVDHRQPVDGDHGIQYEPADPTQDFWALFAD